MKKFFAALAIVLMAAPFAHARSNDGAPNSSQDSGVTGVAYTCTLTGDISGASIGVILGGEYISGPGMVTCRNGDEIRTLPVRMRLIGFGPAFDLSVIRSIHIVSANIGVVGGPEALLTNYSLGASAGVTLVNAGVAFDAAAKVSGEGGVSFELGFQGRDVIGLGAHLYGMGFSIEAR